MGENEPIQDTKSLRDDKRRGVNRRKKKKEKKSRAMQVAYDSVYRHCMYVCVYGHNYGENKKKMTSMYTNTHLTAKK